MAGRRLGGYSTHFSLSAGDGHAARQFHQLPHFLPVHPALVTRQKPAVDLIYEFRYSGWQRQDDEARSLTRLAQPRVRHSPRRHNLRRDTDRLLSQRPDPQMFGADRNEEPVFHSTAQ